jgi:uncharacterized RDD family membrane protein YckC
VNDAGGATPPSGERPTGAFPPGTPYPPPYGYPPYGTPYPPSPYGYPPYGTPYPPPYGYPPYGFAPPPPIYFDSVLGLPLAPWWKRLLAYLVDGFVIYAFAEAVYALTVFIGTIGWAANPTAGAGHAVSAAGVAAFIVTIGTVVLVVPGIYNGIGDGMYRGQTLGKMALGIAVRDARSATLIGFWRGVGRYYFNVLLTVFLYVPFLIGNLAPLWDARRQSWADHVAHSVVVEVHP